MSALLNAVYQVPQYLMTLFTGQYRLYAFLAAAVFLIVMLFTNRVVTVLRDLFVLAAVVWGVVSYFRGQFEMFWICVGALVILAVFRLLRYIIVSITDSRRSRRIERAALAKAEKRRGSWKERKGYSGERPEGGEGETEEENGEIPYISRDQRETEESRERRSVYDAAPVIPPEEKPLETADGPEGSGDTEDGEPEEAEGETGTLSSKTLSREQAISAAHKLRDLKDLGIMTPEEFEQIKARLYSRLG